MLGPIEGLDLLGREAPGAQLSDAVLHQVVASLKKIGREQCSAVWDEVLDAHARREGVAHGLANGALQGDRVAKGLNHGQQGDDVAVTQGLGQTLGVEGDVLHLAGRAGTLRVDALQQCFLRAGQSGQPATQAQQVLQVGAWLEFVNGGVVSGTGQGHTGANRWDHDDVAGLQSHVFGFVTADNEVVQVERGDGLTVALEFDGAHAAVDTGAATGKHGVDQGGQAREVVGARLLGLAHHKHGDAAQLAQGGIDLNGVEDGGDAFAQGLFQVFDAHAAQGDGTDFGQVDLAAAVKGLAACKVNTAPDLDAHFVAWAQDVFGRGGCGGVCGIGLGVFKQAGTEVGQQFACAFLHKALKLAGGLWLGRAKLHQGGALRVCGTDIWPLGHEGRGHQTCWGLGGQACYSRYASGGASGCSGWDASCSGCCPCGQAEREVLGLSLPAPKSEANSEPCADGLTVKFWACGEHRGRDGARSGQATAVPVAAGQGNTDHWKEVEILQFQQTMIVMRQADVNLLQRD